MWGLSPEGTDPSATGIDRRFATARRAGDWPLRGQSPTR